MEGITYYDIKSEPFKLYGVYYSEQDGHYRRIPQSVADATNDGVKWLSKNTAGGRVRFKTNSNKIVIKVKNKDAAQMFHTTPLMQFGFDLYNDTARGSSYLGTFKPAFTSKTDYEAELIIPSGEKELTLNFPLYGCVVSLEIGINEGSTLGAHAPYKYEQPIVYYGSSITQGGCASRPGKSYQDILCRRFDYNYINLGFSGSAKGEDAICEYMASLDMSAFVSDYDHNAPSHEHLQNTHHKLYETIRAKHPDIPYIMVSRPNFKYNEDCFERRAIIMESYIKARRNGDKNVYFVDGSDFFVDASVLGEMTIDGTHPTDDGFVMMARNIGAVIENVFPWESMK